MRIVNEKRKKNAKTIICVEKGVDLSTLHECLFDFYREVWHGLRVRRQDSADPVSEGQTHPPRESKLREVLDNDMQRERPNRLECQLHVAGVRQSARGEVSGRKIRCHFARPIGDRLQRGVFPINGKVQIHLHLQSSKIPISFRFKRSTPRAFSFF